jgi:hypothetical protein
MKPRNPRNFSKEFARRAGLLGFGKTRFHDLRGCHRIGPRVSMPAFRSTPSRSGSVMILQSC